MTSSHSGRLSERITMLREELRTLRKELKIVDQMQCNTRHMVTKLETRVSKIERTQKGLIVRVSGIEDRERKRESEAE